MAVGEHYQAWSEEVQEKIVSLFSHRLQSTAELRAKLEDANSLLSDWLKIGNNMAERRDRKSVVSVKSVSVRVGLGGSRIIKTKKKTESRYNTDTEWQKIK